MEFDALPISAERIRGAVRRLGIQVVGDYTRGIPSDQPAELTVVPILTGAYVLAADLVREFRNEDGSHPLQLSIRIEWLKAASYRRATSPGVFALDPSSLDPASITGKHVLVVDDIIDSGRTLLEAYKTLLELRPESLRSLVLLDKPERRDRSLEVSADYVGFTIPDVFVVGYGLDFDGLFRHLPYVTTLDVEDERPIPFALPE
jgi:hypoxanthine phosphoribosyltransferase